MQKTFFITGASKGFGFEIARAALDAGDQVIASVRKDPDALRKNLGSPPDLEVVLLDVANEEQTKAAVEQGIHRFHTIDTLVNNAGYGIIGAIEEASTDEITRQYTTNVFGLLNVTRSVLPHMRARRSGHIINISSMFGFDVIAGWGIYGSTKFAVEGISKGLAIELAALNIKVTAVEPGLFSTGFLSGESAKSTQNSIADYSDTAGQMKISAARLHGNQSGDPEKLARAVVRLAHTNNPPLHLLMGSDAVGLYNSNLEKMNKDIKEWLEVSLSTDHDHLQ